MRRLKGNVQDERTVVYLDIKPLWQKQADIKHATTEYIPGKAG